MVLILFLPTLKARLRLPPNLPYPGVVRPGVQPTCRIPIFGVVDGRPQFCSTGLLPRHWRCVLGFGRYSVFPGPILTANRSRPDPTYWVGTSKVRFSASIAAGKSEGRPNPSLCAQLRAKRRLIKLRASQGRSPRDRYPLDTCTPPNVLAGAAAVARPAIRPRARPCRAWPPPPFATGAGARATAVLPVSHLATSSGLFSATLYRHSRIDCRGIVASASQLTCCTSACDGGPTIAPVFVPSGFHPFLPNGRNLTATE